jgi:hypothetical protein
VQRAQTRAVAEFWAVLLSCMMDIMRAIGGVLDSGPHCLSGTPSLLAQRTCRAVHRHVAGVLSQVSD